MPYIILDRDGVINHDSDYYIKNPDEWLPISGSLDAIAKLNANGYEVFIVTNQSGVARGHYDLAMLENIHKKLHATLAEAGGKIKEIFFCPHHPDEACECRKPQPGLIYKIQKKYNLDLTQTYFIGDSKVDIQAAKEAGCKPILVLTGNGLKTIENFPDAALVPQFKDLAHAVDAIITQKQGSL
ncbi:MAG: D-glycero-beta-D-manno-heptose 1,7-bisphosphate 7-phosphatase [Gammaproteobacteria bacterium]|nr:D-glycero-beta-D-manno-heptose 1,7-bisphosphate 7-phosphatase [Gammaproteobacteria bacterium]